MRAGTCRDVCPSCTWRTLSRCRCRAAWFPHAADSVHGSPVPVQVDMYKVVESWRTMERPLFVSIMHLLLYTKHIGSEGALEQYQMFVRMLARDYQEACGHAASDLTPFDQYPGYVRKVRMYIKASPLGGVRKITPLTPGQIKRAVENMYVGGFSMLQVRASAAAAACIQWVHMPPSRLRRRDRRLSGNGVRVKHANGGPTCAGGLRADAARSDDVPRRGHCVTRGCVLQARVVFGITAMAGVRTTFFQYWQWKATELVKVAMVNGDEVPADSGTPGLKVLAGTNAPVPACRSPRIHCVHPCPLLAVRACTLSEPLSHLVEVVSVCGCPRGGHV